MTGIYAKLTHIVTVARAGSFSKAAGELHISQPALSRSVASVERSYGVQLFERSRSGIAVTSVGRCILAEAEELLKSIRTFEHNSLLYGRGDAGEIAIGFGPLVASALMPVIGPLILRTRPDVALTVSIRSPDALLEQLLGDEIELFFYAGDQIAIPADVATIGIGRIGVRFIVRENHPLLGKTSPSVQDLASFSLACGTSTMPATMFSMRAALRCDNYHILREVVLESDAIWLASPSICAPDLEAGRLVELDLPDAPAMWSDVTLFRQGGRSVSPLARQIVGMASDYFDKAWP